MSDSFIEILQYQCTRERVLTPPPSVAPTEPEDPDPPSETFLGTEKSNGKSTSVKIVLKDSILEIR